jgi:phage terminase Nu1 subunit (DNA packaging protein)
VRAIEDVGGPERFAAWAVTQRREWAARSTFGDTGDWRQMPAPVRLAFEMAIHEDAERRAMDGELATLERAWAEAEGVARIADALLVPADVQRKLDDLRDTRAPE